jgi:hypothetical protein
VARELREVKIVKFLIPHLYVVKKIVNVDRIKATISTGRTLARSLEFNETKSTQSRNTTTSFGLFSRRIPCSKSEKKEYIKKLTIFNPSLIVFFEMQEKKT